MFSFNIFIFVLNLRESCAILERIMSHEKLTCFSIKRNLPSPKASMATIRLSDGLMFLEQKPKNEPNIL